MILVTSPRRESLNYQFSKFLIKSSHTSFKLILCSSPTVLDDQLCYKVDLNNYLTGENVEENLKSGLSLLVDYNEDRQIIPKLQQSQENANFAGKIGIHRNLGATSFEKIP